MKQASLMEYHFFETNAMRTQREKQHPKYMKAQTAKHLQNNMKELLLIQNLSHLWINVWTGKVKYKSIHSESATQ